MIQYASASNRTGPYTILTTGDWAGFGALYEGPSLVQVNSTTWRLYLDHYVSRLGIYYTESTDDWATWSAPVRINIDFAPSTLTTDSGVYNHPTIIRSFDVDLAWSVIQDALSRDIAPSLTPGLYLRPGSKHFRLAETHWAGGSSSRLGIQPAASADDMSLDLYSGPANGTKTIAYTIFSTGTPESITTSRYGEWKYDSANTEYALDTGSVGTTALPINLYAGTRNQMYLATNGRIGIGTTSPTAKLFLLDTLPGSTASGSFAIRSSNTLGSVASISATSLTSGTLMQFTVAASTSGGGNYFVVKDTAGAVYASLSSGGRFSIRRSFFSRGAINTTCVGPGNPSGCIDYAENFHTQDSSIESGDVIALDPASDSQDIIKAKTGALLLGVISSNPGVLLRGDTVRIGTADSNESITEDYNNGFRPVALAGRVPVKVSFENGDIKKGDYLTSSSIPGKAAKAIKQGRVIGIALESATNDSNKTQIMLLINPHWAGQELDVNGQLADFSGLPSLLDQNPGLIEAILAYLKDAVLTVKELVADVITTKEVNTQKICVGDTCVTEDQLKQLLDKAQLLPASSQSDNPEAVLTPSISPSPEPTLTPSASPEPSLIPELVSPSPTPELIPTPETPVGTVTPAPETTPAPEEMPSTPTPAPEPSPVTE